VHDFATKYEKQFGHPPNFAAEIGYSAAQVVVLALQKAGRALTADTFIAALESIKDYKDIFGSPTMSFSATKHQGSNECFVTQVKDGKWVQVGTESYSY
jgi:branched-chain amino acid transport system substrate-binding protein